ncbi:Protein kinase superfamily protein, partial [Prunus dulcis]
MIGRGYGPHAPALLVSVSAPNNIQGSIKVDSFSNWHICSSVENVRVGRLQAVPKATD